MRIVLLASHAVAEYDDLRMLTDLGYDVFSPGGYADPAHPTEDLRPALDVPAHRDLAFLCDIQREKHLREPLSWAIDWAKADLHPDIVDWADAIIVHHFPDRWIGGQWDAISRRRVIWRTCGQSTPAMEAYMIPFRRAGLQIVRYSPKEKTAFGPMFAGEDAMIRFGKYPGDFLPWEGCSPGVGNLTQDMVGRAAHTGLAYWEAATEGLPVRPAGAKSEGLRGGLGRLTYEEMLRYWAETRAHLYTGTIPASYTLSLIEAMMTGCPTVSIGPSSPLFEGDAITGLAFDDPLEARQMLRAILQEDAVASHWSLWARSRALQLFDVGTVGKQWKEFIG